MAFVAELAYPAVLKPGFQTITHKTVVGGVQLNLLDIEAVRPAIARSSSPYTRRATAPSTFWA